MDAFTTATAAATLLIGVLFGGAVAFDLWQSIHNRTARFSGGLFVGFLGTCLMLALFRGCVMD